MIYESYIVGGIGSYVLGDVLSGTISKGDAITMNPSSTKAEVVFVERNKKLVDKAQAGESVAIALTGVKCSQIRRGMVISSRDDTPKTLHYALGFFYGSSFKGEVKSGMKFYIVNNKIARLCQIEIKSIVRFEEGLLENTGEITFKKGNVAFIKIFPVDPLVLDDPHDFPDFSLVKLIDNCQEIAIGKIFKMNYVEDLIRETLFVRDPDEIVRDTVIIREHDLEDAPTNDMLK